MVCSGCASAWSSKRPSRVMSIHFAANVCSASWESTAGTLPCSGTPNDPRGWVMVLTNPRLENRQEDQPTLWTNPPLDGRRDHHRYLFLGTGKIRRPFRCRHRLPVRLRRLRCEIPGEIPPAGRGTFTLGEYNEEYDDELNRIDISLEDLEERNVTFFLVVQARGDPAQAAAVWLNPYLGPPP